MLRMLGFNVLYDEVRGWHQLEGDVDDEYMAFFVDGKCQMKTGHHQTVPKALFFFFLETPKSAQAGTIGKRYRRMDEAEGRALHSQSPKGRLKRCVTKACESKGQEGAG